MTLPNLSKRHLTPTQRDRARGAVVASAAADALGSQYEFGPPLPQDHPITFGTGYFGTAPGEWTDDTSMAVPILQQLALGRPLCQSATLATISEDWRIWAQTAPDVGVQTRGVLSALGPGHNEEDARAAARRTHMTTGRSGGNGSLMRTGPVALGYLGEGEQPRLVKAAGRVAQLTHWENDNVDACALWSLAIRCAVLTGQFQIVRAVQWLPGDRRQRWVDLIEEALAPGATPATFHKTNGWVVSAFQASLAAINTTDNLVAAIEAAIRGGNDTDTVAAITASLAGAIYGVSALPSQWLDEVHGWPGLTAKDLVALVHQTIG